MSVRATTHSGLMGRRRPIPAANRRSEELLQSMLQNICDTGIAICVLAVPLTMAGIREYGIALFILCSFVAGITWATQQLLTPTSNSPVGAAATIAGLSIGLVWLQLQPLPDHWLASLSPFTSRFLTLWGSPEGRILKSSGWHQISMTPEATRSGLVLLVAYAMFFLTLVQRLRTQQDIDRLIKLVGISAAVMGTIGIAQIVIGDDRFLWMIDHPTRTASWPAKGTFTNQNHFAHFLALGIGPLLWWWQSFDQNDETQDLHKSSRSRRRGPTSRRSSAGKPSTIRGARFRPQGGQWPRLLIGACAGVLTIGAVCSISRGGITAFLVAAAIALCAIGRSWTSVLRVAIILAIFLAAALSAFGTEEFTDRWNQIAQAKSIGDLSHGRWVLWTALVQAVSEFWPSGSGVGSHADIYPIWMSSHFDVRFSHAECGYLQILLETGVPGFVLLLAAIGLCGWWCVHGWYQGTKQQRCRIAALAAGLVASALHSLIDFVWYIPGCMIITLVVIACVCRCSHLTRPAADSGRRPDTRFATVFAGLLLVCLLPVGQLFAGTIQRDLSSSAHWQSFHNGMREIAEDLSQEQVELLNSRLDFLIDELEHCTAEDPFHHDADSALAPLYLQRFERASLASANQMTLQDVRDTVRHAEFKTGREMHEWLIRAFGDGIRDLYKAVSTARRALRERPLRSEAYIVLSETAFLSGSSRRELEAIIDQAVRVRPHEPGVLYAAGLLANDAGNVETAWQLWRHAAALDPGIAGQIVSQFIERMPPDQLIEQLSPTKTTYRILYSAFQQKGKPEDQKTVAVAFANDYLEALKEGGTDTAHDLRYYAILLNVAEYHEDAIRCLKRAVRLQPGDVSARRLLARTLADRGQLEDAHRELNWLRMRLPDDQTIAGWLNEVESALTAAHSSPNPDGGQPARSDLLTGKNGSTAVLPVSVQTDFEPPIPPHDSKPAVSSRFTESRSHGDSTITQRPHATHRVQ